MDQDQKQYPPSLELKRPFNLNEIEIPSDVLQRAEDGNRPQLFPEGDSIPSRFNLLSLFPKETIPHLLEFLSDTADFLPDSTELKKEMDIGSSTKVKFEIEGKYGDLADFYITEIFPDYFKLKFYTDHQTLSLEQQDLIRKASILRSLFYLLIRPMSADLIQKALYEINKRGGVPYLLNLIEEKWKQFSQEEGEEQDT